MKVRVQACFLVLFFCSLHLQAQVNPFISEKSLSPKKNYSVQYWNTENGLPQNSVNDIKQTKDGYLWLATYDGLVRFDGIHFKTFNTGNTSELKTSGIRRLFVDEEDRLWLITIDGNLISYSHNKFTAYDLPAKIDYIKNTITCFENGSVIIVCGNNQLFKLKNGVFEPFPVPHFNRIYCIKAVDQAELFVGTSAGLWSLANGKWKNCPPPLDKTPISELYLSPANELIVDAIYKLYSIKGNSCRPIDIPFLLNPHYEYSINFFENGALAVLADTGLLVQTKNGFTAITMRDGLSSNSIRSLFLDKEKNIWIGTNNGGLNKLKPKLFKSYSKDDGMMDDGITAILQTRNGIIHFGNNCRGSSEFFNGSFSQDFLPPRSNNCIWSFLEDKESNLWVGTYGGGLSVYRDNSEKNNYMFKDGLADNTILALYTDAKNTMWIGTLRGLSKYENKKFSVPDTSFHSSITYITEDSKGQIWLCTDKGLARLQNNRVVLSDHKKGFKEDAVRYIYEDKTGTFWVGTHGAGLARIKNGKVFYFNDYTSQLDKNVWSITEDASENLWMPSNAGMYVVGKKELNDFADKRSATFSPVYLSKEDGLKSIEFNGGFQPSVLKMQDGKLWFPTVKGAALADPGALFRSTYTPQVLIEKLSLDDSLIEVKDTLFFSALSSNLIISFTAPSFINPSRINFEYKLEGFNKAWNELGTAREIKINNLPDGTNRLRIRVAGKENGKEAILVISKPIPIWKQTRFLIGAILVFLLILLLTAFFVIRLINNREKRKTQLNKQYADIELKALQSQLNPHFIFNCLNSIQHFILANDEVSASKYLTKFSLLMRMYLEHSKSNLVTLHQEAELLKLYVEIESLRFKNGFNFEFHIDDSIDAFNLQVPSMLFQPYVENAIKHGLLNLDRKGSLTIIFKAEDSKLVGIVEDDGVGRQKAEELKSSTHREHPSRGMKIIADRINVINSIEKTDITIEVIDKPVDKEGITGTRIIIRIPI